MISLATSPTTAAEPTDARSLLESQLEFHRKGGDLDSRKSRGPEYDRERRWHEHMVSEIKQQLAELDGKSASRQDDPLDEALAAILPTREANALENHLGAIFVGDLRGRTLERLMRVPNFAHTSLLALAIPLAFRGIDLRELLRKEPDA